MSLGEILGISIPIGYALVAIVSYVILTPYIYRDEIAGTQYCNCDPCKIQRKSFPDEYTKEQIRRIQARYHAQKWSISLSTLWPLTIIFLLATGVVLGINNGIFRPIKRFAYRSISREEKAEDLRRRFDEDVNKEKEQEAS